MARVGLTSELYEPVKEVFEWDETTKCSSPIQTPPIAGKNNSDIVPRHLHVYVIKIL